MTVAPRLHENRHKDVNRFQPIFFFNKGVVWILSDNKDPVEMEDANSTLTQFLMRDC